MRTGRTAGFTRVRTGFAVVGTVACVTALSVAPVALGSGATAASIKESRSKTVTLGARQTKTINVFYPNALKGDGYSYACTYKIAGVDPGKIRILSHGSALGGTVCRVKAHNPAAPSVDASVRIKVTATTTRPGSRRSGSSSSPTSGLG